MFKAKLNEWAQRNGGLLVYDVATKLEEESRISNYIATVKVTLKASPAQPLIFNSKSPHPSKKKAENCAAEEAIVGLSKLKPQRDDVSDKDLLIASVSKAMRTSTDIFRDYAPVEVLLLFHSVYSVLSRIDPMLRRDGVAARLYLIKTLQSAGRLGFLDQKLCKDGRLLIKKNVLSGSSCSQSNSVEVDGSSDQSRTRTSNDPSNNTLHCVLIPAISSEQTPVADFEINFFKPSENSRSLVNILSIIAKQIKAKSGLTFSQPIYVPTTKETESLSTTGTTSNTSEPHPVPVTDKHVVAAHGTHSSSAAAAANATNTAAAAAVATLTVRRARVILSASPTPTDHLNPIATWLTGTMIHGDAAFVVFSGDIKRTTDIVSCLSFSSPTSRLLTSAFRAFTGALVSTFPTGLWADSSNSVHSPIHLGLPRWYFPQTWAVGTAKAVATKLPSTILRELVGRRAGSAAEMLIETITESSSSSSNTTATTGQHSRDDGKKCKDDGAKAKADTDTDASVGGVGAVSGTMVRQEEGVPADGWWSVGLSALQPKKNHKVSALSVSEASSNNNNQTDSDYSDSSSAAMRPPSQEADGVTTSTNPSHVSSPGAARGASTHQFVPQLLPGKIYVRITLPEAPGLFSLSGKVYTADATSTMAKDVSHAENLAALEVLHDIQRCGEEMLSETYCKGLFGSYDIPEDIPSTAAATSAAYTAAATASATASATATAVAVAVPHTIEEVKGGNSKEKKEENNEKVEVLDSSAAAASPMDVVADSDDDSDIHAASTSTSTSTSIPSATTATSTPTSPTPSRGSALIADNGSSRAKDIVVPAAAAAAAAAPGGGASRGGVEYVVAQLVEYNSAATGKGDGPGILLKNRTAEGGGSSSTGETSPNANHYKDGETSTSAGAAAGAAVMMMVADDQIDSEKQQEPSSSSSDPSSSLSTPLSEIRVYTNMGMLPRSVETLLSAAAVKKPELHHHQQHHSSNDRSIRLTSYEIPVPPPALPVELEAKIHPLLYMYYDTVREAIRLHKPSTNVNPSATTAATAAAATAAVSAGKPILAGKDGGREVVKKEKAAAEDEKDSPAKSLISQLLASSLDAQTAGKQLPPPPPSTPPPPSGTSKSSTPTSGDKTVAIPPPPSTPPPPSARGKSSTPTSADKIAPPPPSTPPPPSAKSKISSPTSGDKVAPPPPPPPLTPPPPSAKRNSTPTSGDKIVPPHPPPPSTPPPSSARGKSSSTSFSSDNNEIVLLDVEEQKADEPALILVSSIMITASKPEGEKTADVVEGIAGDKEAGGGHGVPKSESMDTPVMMTETSAKAENEEVEGEEGKDQHGHEKKEDGAELQAIAQRLTAHEYECIEAYYRYVYGSRGVKDFIGGKGRLDQVQGQAQSDRGRDCDRDRARDRTRADNNRSDEYGRSRERSRGGGGSLSRERFEYREVDVESLATVSLKPVRVVAAARSDRSDISSIRKRIALLVVERTAEADYKSIRKLATPNLFFPSLADQRRRLVATFLRATGAESWLDVGCGNCTFLISCIKPDGSSGDPNSFVTHTPHVRHVGGLELNPVRIKEARRDLLPLLPSEDADLLQQLTTTETEANTEAEADLKTNLKDSSGSASTGSTAMEVVVEDDEFVPGDTPAPSRLYIPPKGPVEIGKPLPLGQVSWYAFGPALPPGFIRVKDRHQSQSNSSAAAATADADAAAAGSINGINENKVHPLSNGTLAGTLSVSSNTPRKSVNTHIESLTLWQGSALTRSTSAHLTADRRWDAITCIEVIEHLPTVEDAHLALEKVLCELQPEYALFSTPNYEANKAIRAAVTGEPYRAPPVPIDSPHNSPKSIAIDRSEPYREEDHKFEFTREEFRQWADTGIVKSGCMYEVEYAFLGEILPGMQDDKEKGIPGCGGATQVAIFRRIRKRTAAEAELPSPSLRKVANHLDASPSPPVKNHHAVATVCAVGINDSITSVSSLTAGVATEEAEVSPTSATKSIIHAAPTPTLTPAAARNTNHDNAAADNDDNNDGDDNDDNDDDIVCSDDEFDETAHRGRKHARRGESFLAAATTATTATTTTATDAAMMENDSDDEVLPAAVATTLETLGSFNEYVSRVSANVRQAGLKSHLLANSGIAAPLVGHRGGGNSNLALEWSANTKEGVPVAAVEKPEKEDEHEVEKQDGDQPPNDLKEEDKQEVGCPMVAWRWIKGEPEVYIYQVPNNTNPNPSATVEMKE